MREIEGLHGAAMVTRAGSVEIAWAGGPTGDAAGSLCTPETRLQIASVSKQFAAALTMLLVEAGTVDLFEPIASFLPGCPAHWRTITVHHLLSHTAGIRHWGDAPGFVPAEPMNLEERISLIGEAPLLSEPGTQWSYSSPGYLVVGYIAARVTHQSYGELLRTRLLDPLALTSTTVGTVPAGEVTARGFRDGQPVVPWGLAEMPGTGDVCSTIGDMTHYNAALHGGMVLTPRSLDAMSTVHAPLADDSEVLTTNGYGYGLYLGDAAGHRVLFHTGDNPGYQSFNAWIPDLKASIVILSNDESDVLEDILKQLLDVALAKQV